MRSGDTLIMLTPGSANPIPHLWFVITDPDPVTYLCAMVSLTTLRGDKDRTVVLQPADHPFITHSSVVHYIGAVIVDARRITTLLKAGSIHQHNSCSAGTLKLIQQGISASPFTPKKIVDFCKRAWPRR